MTPEEVTDLRRWHEASGGIADGRPFLGDRRLDAMVEVMLELSAQIWVLRRRNTVLESALTERGALAADTVEQHTLAPEATAALRAERADFVATIFRSLSELPATLPEKEA